MSDCEPAPMPRAETARILLTTAPPDVAQGIARTLVEERLAACVNLVPGVRSVYRWEGAVQDDPETLMVVKTAADGIEALGARLQALHPYEVPEQIVLEPQSVGPAYLSWLLDAVTDPGER